MGNMATAHTPMATGTATIKETVTTRTIALSESVSKIRVPWDASSGKDCPHTEVKNVYARTEYGCRR